MQTIQGQSIRECLDALEKANDEMDQKTRQDISETLVSAMLILMDKCAELGIGYYDPELMDSEEETQ